MPDQDTQIIPVPTEMEIIEHQFLLGTGKTYDISHLLRCYDMSLWVMEENKEWSNNKYLDFTAAKFVLLRQKVLEQIKVDGRFNIITPFKNPCTKCYGSGEIYKFIRRIQTLKCMKCAEGFLQDSKCPTCKGKGKLKTFAITPQLRNTTTCTYCRGKGFFKEKVLDNPLFDQDTAIQVKKKLAASVIEKPGITNLGSKIKTANTEPNVIANSAIFDPDQDKKLGLGTSQKKQQPPSQ